MTSALIISSSSSSFSTSFSTSGLVSDDRDSTCIYAEVSFGRHVGQTLRSNPLRLPSVFKFSIVEQHDQHDHVPATSLPMGIRGFRRRR